MKNTNTANTFNTYLAEINFRASLLNRNSILKSQQKYFPIKIINLIFYSLSNLQQLFLFSWQVPSQCRIKTNKLRFIVSSTCNKLAA